jgi:hypothetical protein
MKPKRKKLIILKLQNYRKVLSNRSRIGHYYCFPINKDIYWSQNSWHWGSGEYKTAVTK